MVEGVEAIPVPRVRVRADVGGPVVGGSHVLRGGGDPVSLAVVDVLHQ